MEGPTEEAEALIPVESAINGGRTKYMGSNSATTTMRREAAKRTLPWDLRARELNLGARISPPLPHDEDIPATKKPRFDPIITRVQQL
jgi:hypothetical protein